MSTQATGPAGPSSAPSKSSKKREKKNSQPSGAASERLKVVVRRLPPDLPEEIFWKSVEPWVSEEKVSWKTFYPGKARKRSSNKENISSRAYIGFKSQEQVAIFGREYDGHAFKDKSGNIATAVVEFAPYQKIPPEKKKIDSRINTIETDDDYISFINSLQADATKRTEADTLEAFSAQNTADTLPTTTPLLEALKADKAAQKEKASVMRNHAHYKDIAVTGIISSKSAPRPAQGDPSTKESKKDKEKRKKDAANKDSAPAQPPTPKKKKGKGGQGGQAASTVPAAGPSKAGQSTADPTNTPSTPQGGKKSRKRQATAEGSGASTSTNPPVVAAASPAAPTSSQPNVKTIAPDVKPPSDAAPAPAPVPVPTRRGRPMLGFASRQFTAALSGAGVQTKRSERTSAPAPADRSQEPASSDVSGATSNLPAPPEGRTPTEAAGARGSSSTRGRGRGRGRGGA